MLGHHYMLHAHHGAYALSGAIIKDFVVPNGDSLKVSFSWARE